MRLIPLVPEGDRIPVGLSRSPPWCRLDGTPGPPAWVLRVGPLLVHWRPPVLEVWRSRIRVINGSARLITTVMTLTGGRR